VRARVLLADLVDDIAPVARLETEARALLAASMVADAARAAASAALGTAATNDDAATGAQAVLAAATLAKEGIEQQQAFHDARLAWAVDTRAPALAAHAAAEGNVAKLVIELALAADRLQAAKAACKVAAFKMAQDALADFQADAAADAITEAAVKKDYDAAAAFPTTEGAEGALCNIPRPDANGLVGARPECLQELDGQELDLCCGAAQRFLKDGTKLTIETCQPRGSTTYTYYPLLPDGALVEPTPETWRFHCISAAQKLAAAATAALAAGYMMA